MHIDFGHLVTVWGREGARAAFESLIVEVLCAKDPNAQPIRPNPGDYGIDCMVPLGDGSQHVYQIKYFPQELDESQKDQIRRSFHRCQDTLGLSLGKWTLVIPRDMSLEETSWFQAWKSKKARVEIAYMGQTRLRTLVSQHEDIVERYFTHNPQTARLVLDKLSSVIEYLRSSAARATRSPALQVLLWKDDDTLVDRLTLPQPPNWRLHDPEQITDEEIDAIVDEWDDIFGGERVRAICDEYRLELRDYLTNVSKHDNLRTCAESSAYLVFAVENTGTDVAHDVTVQLSIPEGIAICGGLGPKFPSPPSTIESRLEALSVQRFTSRMGIGSVSGNDSIIASMAYPWRALAIEPSLRARLTPPGILNERRSSITYDRGRRTATFWLKEVMHHGCYDCHLQGLQIAAIDNTDTQIDWRILSASLPEPSIGSIQVQIRPDADISEWRAHTMANKRYAKSISGTDDETDH